MRKLLSLILTILYFTTSNASAQLNVSISGANQAPIPIAFPNIISDNNGVGAFLGFSYANKVRDVVLADLGKKWFATYEEAELELANRQQSHAEAIMDERNGR